jgi:hypothetical protein
MIRVSSEDELTIPAEWARLVHPRRGGITPPTPTTSQQDRDRFDAAWQARLAKVWEILADADTDSQLVAAFESDSTTVLGAGVMAALACYLTGAGELRVLMDRWVLDHGPTFAALALEETAGLLVGGNMALWDPTRRPFLRRLTADEELHGQALWVPLWECMATRLRVHLALVADDDYASVAAALATYRERLMRQRILATYLVPERQDWFDEDMVVPPLSNVPKEMLFYAAGSFDRLKLFHASTTERFVTAVDVLGTAAAPLLARWYGNEWTSPDIQRDCAAVLWRIPTDEAFDLLLDRIEQRHVGPALLSACAAFPHRAARLLARRSDDWSVHLLHRHQLAHPDVAGAGAFRSGRLPDATADEAPRVLQEPPWKQPRPGPVAVPDAPSDTVMEWQSGERERWLGQRAFWSHAGEDWSALAAEYLSGRLRPWDQTRLMAYGPAELVRPLLHEWDAAKAETYLLSLEPFVAAYELDALTPIMKFARAKPQIGASLLLPYCNPEVGWMMADWLVRSRPLRPTARSWFDRHAEHGAAMLIPKALGGTLAERRIATVALLRLDPDVVRRGADVLGLANQVETLLETDPLALVPAKVPAPPAWMDPALLPQVLLSGGTHALPNEAMRAFLSMIAISEPGQAYDGLTIVRRACDSDSLCRFAWALYRLWELEGRPSKYAWAFDALGYLGDDSIIERLVPMIRRWPTDGAIARARRGVDVLAGIGTDAALHELSRLARSAKSSPLRAYAAGALEQAGLERGLLPEQLADRLVPDPGLTADQFPLVYRETEYAPFVDGDLELKLRTSGAKVLATLPKPATYEEKDLATAWRSLRKQTNALLMEQARRMESAMVEGRTWSPAEVRSVLLDHPILGEIARRLIWAHGDQTFVIDDGAFADADGTPVAVTELVKIAHPAEFDLTPWRDRLANLAIQQPFPQADREAFADLSLDGILGRVVSTASLMGLARRGWQWSEREQAGMRRSLWRAAAGGHIVHLHIDPGSYAGAMTELQQTLVRLEFSAPAGAPTSFAALPLIARSELLRDLARLA